MQDLAPAQLLPHEWKHAVANMPCKMLTRLASAQPCLEMQPLVVFGYYFTGDLGTWLSNGIRIWLWLKMFTPNTGLLTLSLSHIHSYIDIYKIWIHTYKYIIYIYTYKSTYTYTYLYTHICVYIYINTHVYIYIYTHKHIFICTYIYM